MFVRTCCNGHYRDGFQQYGYSVRQLYLVQFNACNGSWESSGEDIYTQRPCNVRSGGVQYDIPVPDSDVEFEPEAGIATVFENGAWKVQAQPCCSSGNTFLSGVSFKVPAVGFPGGIKNVRWTG